ncbi:MAG: two-component sensor histidine kinase [Hyphomicrobiales bacterium]|uniref:ATP-binding protein n=1 Tax=Rhabdaerophilum calidifontis TaxID=2604328 RepID=UPI00123902C2|nr:ATP-binding protein [Rhabdaerophilum calidifontis]MCA1951775.1 two-component sensor histidine kinase [Hyphomicrobiales bacterium]MCA2000081.1 two-component sensor histidine kinase [Hyphomicrobiales bacterium]
MLWRILRVLTATLGRGLAALWHGLARLATRIAALPPVARALAPFARAEARLGRWINRMLPKRLYTRALLIVIIPVVLLQAVVAYVFMERHWQAVTARLSASLTQDIAALIEIYESFPQDAEGRVLAAIAERRLGLDIDFLPLEPLPPPVQKPFFDILDQALSSELRQRVRRPFWLDTVGSSSILEIRILLDTAMMRVIARRSQAYASNSHIFLAWMAGSSLVLVGVAVIILRNQIRPILRLADAAEDFGKGRDVQFRPRGAREVRRAGLAFLEMKSRIERAIEQRTTMLNGVSHDLRTILTRFRLSLALIEPGPEVEDLKRDVDEMSKMLEAYLAFARGEAAESAVPTDIRALLEVFRADAERSGHFCTLAVDGDPVVSVRPQAFRRLLGNLVANAARYGDRIEIRAVHDERFLTVTVDDDGPGIPEESREEVFRPFLRLDAARNQDHAGTGLGLAIARDIARGHGGDIVLEDAPLGGLRARVKVPA